MSRKLEDLHPLLKEKAEQLIKLATNEGINITITSTLRTIAEQNDLYAQGRTKKGSIVTTVKGGYSYHNFGLAFDFAVVDANGKINWNVDSRWKKVGKLGESLGLEWGGSWKGFVDVPHFQLTFGLTTAQLRDGKKPPTSEVKTAVESVTNVKEPKNGLHDGKLYWDGLLFKKGQIGKITILKNINLWTDDKNGKLKMVRVLNKGEEYRVYNYRTDHGGQYNVGDSHYITKMDGFIKYQTPSKNLLKLAENIK